MARLDLPEQRMEPEADLRGDRWRHSQSSNDHSLRSIAISLKRLADMADQWWEWYYERNK